MKTALHLAEPESPVVVHRLLHLRRKLPNGAAWARAHVRLQMGTAGKMHDKTALHTIRGNKWITTKKMYVQIFKNKSFFLHRLFVVSQMYQAYLWMRRDLFCPAYTMARTRFMYISSYLVAAVLVRKQIPVTVLLRLHVCSDRSTRTPVFHTDAW